MKLKSKVIPILAIAVLSVYPCLFLYFQNVSECNLADIGGTMALLLLISIGSALILWGILRDFSKGALAASILMLLFLNFALIESLIAKLFPRVHYWHAAILLLFLWGGVCVLINSLVSSDNAKMADGIILMVFGALIVINGITALPHIVSKLSAEHADTQVGVSIDKRADLPNFYYLIFDEYGGPENLAHYCNFDNSDFYEELKKIGFNLSETSHNETYFTGVVVTNLLNLQYVGEYTGDAKTTDWTALTEQRDNPPFYQILLNAGYQLNMVDSEQFLDATESTYHYDGVSQILELTAPYMILSKTAAYPFYQSSGEEELDNLNNMFEYLRESPQLQDQNLWTMAYFNTPHDPWYADENGNPLDGANRSNWNDPNIYLGQLKYLNKKIAETVHSIITQDPDCIIVIQSDHGWRRPVNLPDLYPDLQSEIPYMTDILNVLYYRNQAFPIEGDSGINTLRAILNETLGLHLPPVDPSEYKGQ